MDTNTQNLEPAQFSNPAPAPVPQYDTKKSPKLLPAVIAVVALFAIAGGIAYMNIYQESAKAAFKIKKNYLRVTSYPSSITQPTPTSIVSSDEKSVMDISVGSVDSDFIDIQQDLQGL